MSILPNILDIIEKYGIRYKQAGREGEYRSICPFCNKKEDYSFQFNTLKNTFICNRANNCGKRGGVLDLVVLLSGESKDEIIAKLRENKGIKPDKKPFHPVLTIPIESLKEMGFLTSSLNWYESYKKNPERTKREMDWVWEEYLNHCKRVKLRKKAIKSLFANLIEKEGVDKLVDCLAR